MLRLLRHLLAIAILPFSVTVLIPVWLARRNGVTFAPRTILSGGVVFVLLGEALLLLSQPHLEWALLFLLINAVFIPLLEEPLLRERFGDEYREYCRHVPRLLPRLYPWRGST